MSERAAELPRLEAAWLGRVDYESGWSAQRALFDARAAGRRGDLLMLLEHPATYTLGRRSLESDLVYDEEQRSARGISLYSVDRGGRATYHGPGQLVGYPIMALGDGGGTYDVIGYLRRLEDALIDLCADLGVGATRDPRHTGVWVGSSKIGAIGVKITRGVTMHGFALNVTTDLSMFEGIVPCGIEGKGVTSVLAETEQVHSLEAVARTAAGHLARTFERELIWTDPGSLFANEMLRAAAAPH